SAIQTNQGSCFARMFSQLAQESRHLNAHVEVRHLFKPRDRSEHQVVRCLPVAQRPFQIGGGQLDESPEKISLLRCLSCPPESLQYFVAFPPIRIVVEIDGIKVVAHLPPLLGTEQDGHGVGMPIGMALGAVTRMRRTTREKSIKRKRTMRVTMPGGVGRLKFNLDGRHTLPGTRCDLPDERR